MTDQRESYAREANSAGHEAFREGVPREANPHRDGTNESFAWDMGWLVEQRWAAIDAAGDLAIRAAE